MAAEREAGAEDAAAVLAALGVAAVVDATLVVVERGPAAQLFAAARAGVEGRRLAGRALAAVAVRCRQDAVAHLQVAAQPVHGGVLGAAELLGCHSQQLFI